MTAQAQDTKSKKRDIRALIQADSTKEQIALALPKYLTPDRMMRVALTTINRTPALLNCTPESLLGGLMLCAQVGLEPDGRLAHLIPYGNQCQVIFDWKGLIELARRNGVHAVPKLVHENDFFMVEEDDGNGKTKVTHRVDYFKARGKVKLAYVRAKNGDGEFDYEFMTAEDIEKVRQDFSKAKDATAWKNSWAEMAKKTVVRRHSKRWPLAPEIAVAFDPKAEETPNAYTRPVFDKPKALFDVTPPPPETGPGVGDDDVPFDSPQPSSSPDKAAAAVNPSVTPESEANTQAPASEKPSHDYAKAVKGLLTLSAISEVELVSYLYREGKLPEGGPGTLKEMAKVAEVTLADVHDHWQSYAEAIKADRDKGKK